VETVRATIGGGIWLEGLPPKTHMRLLQRLSFENPKYGLALAMKRSTDGIDETIQAFVEYPDGSIMVPRGAMTLIQETLAYDDVPIVFEDLRYGGKIISLPLASIRLRPYQTSAIHALMESDYQQGTIVVGCGGGKTRIGIAAIQRIRRATLILVHTKDLLDQWVAEIKTLLDVDAGTVYEGEVRYADITVALIQTLINNVPARIDSERIGVCIVDEAHHAPANTYQMLLPYIPARWRLGLTATPTREDRMTRLMDWSFGDRLFEISADELVRQGYLMRPKLEIVETDFTFTYNGSDARKNTALNRKIIANNERNQRIVEIATRDAKSGETVVILSNNRAHCRLLGRMCWEQGVETAVLVSGASKRAKEARQRTMDELRTGALRLAVATSLFDEGISIDRLSRVVLALPQRSRGTTEQRTGRLMRLFAGKEPKLYDVVDSRVEMLERRWQARRRVYKRLGLIADG